MSDEPRVPVPPVGGPPPVPPVPPLPPVPEMPPTPEVTLGGGSVEAPRVPGAPRATFDRLPTAPVPEQTATGPAEDGSTATVPVPGWIEPAPAAPRRGVAAWALVFAILGLAISLFVGWGFPIGLIGVVTGIVALRRPVESRGVAWWAIALGLVSVLYSAGWLMWAATQTNLFG